MHDYVQEYDTQNCGVTELDGISSCRPDVAIADLTIWGDSNFYDLEKNIYIFTQARKTKAQAGYGFDLANYIENNGLGVVRHSDTAKNPNSGNYVTVFVWTVNHVGLKRWAKQRVASK